MATTEDIDLLVIAQDEQQEIDELKEEYKDVTYVQAMSGFYAGCKNVSHFLAGGSVFLALGTPLFLAEKMPDISIIIFCVVSGALIGIEKVKEYTLKGYNKIRIINKKKKKKEAKIPTGRYQFAFITLVSLDILMGFFGSSHVVDTLIPVQGIVEISSLDTTFSKREALDTMFLFKSKSEYLAKAFDVHDKNKWRGVTVTDARPIQLELEKSASKAQDSILAVMSAIAKEKQIAINELKAQNKEVLKEHKDFCYSFGWAVALIATFINVWLVILAFWNADFDEKKIQDANSRKQLLESDSQDTHVPTASDNKAEDTEKTENDGKNTNKNADFVQQPSEKEGQMAYAKDSNGIQIRMGNDGTDTANSTTKVCSFSGCQKPFLHNVHNQKFCSDSCRKKNHNHKNK